jgi:hypothetical protein
MFSADDIQARIRERPFVPVRVVTSSVQTYDVSHPDLVLIARRFLVVGVASNENPAQAETVSRVAIMHITDLQDLPIAPGTSTNGAPPQ